MMVALAIAQITGKPLAAETNRQRTCEVIEQAFADGADLVVLPEMIVPGYCFDAAGLKAIAEPVDGPTVSAWQAIASTHGGYVAGGFCERDGEALYNTAVLVGPDNIEPVLHYRKLHLFDREKKIFQPGDNGLPIVTTPIGAIGICVCYDLRFVEVVRGLALCGAEIIVVPTAWVPGFDKRHWDSEGYCPQARGAVVQANLNQVYIACASQVGSNGDIDFLGSSLLVDPWGKPLVGPLGGDTEIVVSARIEAGAVTEARERGGLISPRADRRTDVYQLSIGGELY